MYQSALPQLFHKDNINCDNAQGRVVQSPIKVQLTPKNIFRLYKSPCFSDHCCEKIIVVAIFVNFL